MADDAAGAVRRTPRPAPVPDLWWSPANRTVVWAAEENGWCSTGLVARHFDETRAADAVKLVSATLLEFALADVREWKHLAEERNGTARVMADLRDQAAAAEADRDAARSDREELRSERDQIANELEDAQQHARNVAAQRDVEHRAHLAAAAELAAVDSAMHGLDSDLGDDATLDARVKELHESYLDALQLNGRWIDEINQLKRDRDLVVWLHAEAQHRLAEEQAASYNMYARVFQALGVSITEPWHGLAEAAQKVVAERDALQARIGDVLAVCDRYDPGLFPLAHVRAAAQGDQPTEPPWFVVKHCCQAGAVAYPEPCPWHVKPAEPTLPRNVEALAAVDEKHVYEDDAASNWEGICRVCSYPPGGPQHIDVPAEPTGEVDRG